MEKIKFTGLKWKNWVNYNQSVSHLKQLPVCHCSIINSGKAQLYAFITGKKAPSKQNDSWS